jgi:hypothetical protein
MLVIMDGCLVDVGRIATYDAMNIASGKYSNGKISLHITLIEEFILPKMYNNSWAVLQQLFDI